MAKYYLFCALVVLLATIINGEFAIIRSEEKTTTNPYYTSSYIKRSETTTDKGNENG